MRWAGLFIGLLLADIIGTEWWGVEAMLDVTHWQSWGLFYALGLGGYILGMKMWRKKS